MPGKFTAVDPNGVTHKRSSVSRDYTHTVVARRSKDNAIKWATSANAREQHVKSFEYYCKIAAGGGHHLYKAIWETDEQNADRRKNSILGGISALGGCKTEAEYVQMKMDADLEAIRKADVKGYYTEYVNMGWCGRLDLAQKLQGTMRARDMLDVTILEVTQK